MRRGSLLVFASFLLASLGFAQEDELSLTWPKLIESDEGTLIVHQPTIENFANGTVTGRSAVVLEPVEGDDEQVFGAARFSATTTGTEGSESVDVSRVTVDQLEFPDSESAAIARRIIESAVSGVTVSVPTAYLERGVQLSGIQQRQQQQAKFNTDAPMVYVESEPTLLVLIDGDPTLTSTSQRGVTRVANTPFDLLRLDSTDKYYLRAGDNWFVADGVLEPWQVETTPPQAVKTVAEQGRRDVELPDAADIPDAPSQIIVSTDPAMLVQVDGEPDLSAIEGTDLLYVRNTASDVLYHIPSQAYYLHDLGRWYRSRDLNDPSGWAAVSLERLPQSLKNIPLDSPLADIRESVPGTPESQQAAIEAQIPQTAQVDRDSASLDVTYQGEPDFQAIEGTDLTYATNTQYPVVYADDSYYSVHDGVWFNSYAPYGPWRVASYVPSSIYGIPSWHPLYPITYVYLTYATPRYAYFSYWPGYTGRYNHFGHVYFGTGWRYSRYYWNHYDPWYWGSHYYGSSYLPGFSFFINITFRDRDHYYDRYRYSRYRYDRHRRYNRRAGYWRDQRRRRFAQSRFQRRFDGRRAGLYQNWRDTQAVSLRRQRQLRQRLGDGPRRRQLRQQAVSTTDVSGRRGGVRTNRALSRQLRERTRAGRRDGVTSRRAFQQERRRAITREIGRGQAAGRRSGRRAANQTQSTQTIQSTQQSDLQTSGTDVRRRGVATRGDSASNVRSRVSRLRRNSGNAAVRSSRRSTFGANGPRRRSGDQGISASETRRGGEPRRGQGTGPAARSTQLPQSQASERGRTQQLRAQQLRQQQQRRAQELRQQQQSRTQGLQQGQQRRATQQRNAVPQRRAIQQRSQQQRSRQQRSQQQRSRQEQAIQQRNQRQRAIQQRSVRQQRSAPQRARPQQNTRQRTTRPAVRQQPAIQQQRAGRQSAQPRREGNSRRSRRNRDQDSRRRGGRN